MFVMHVALSWHKAGVVPLKPHYIAEPLFSQYDLIVSVIVMSSSSVLMSPSSLSAEADGAAVGRRVRREAGDDEGEEGTGEEDAADGGDEADARQRYASPLLLPLLLPLPAHVPPSPSCGTRAVHVIRRTPGQG